MKIVFHADNTTKEFYSLWSHEQLIDELIRINKLLNEIKDI
jgi:hypothetical protein